MKTLWLNIRINESVKSKLKELAELNSRSMASQIEYSVNQEYKKTIENNTKKEE